MSQKITPKNLSYNSSLPPFLARLQAQAAGASGPDPIAAAQRRSGKKRSASEEAEDGPLVVDEEGNVVSLDVDDDGAIKGEAEKHATDGKTDLNESPGKAESDGKAAIGGRKRKVGKVVGDAAEEASERKDDKASEKKEKESESSTAKKPKKKAKKIKLSFDEEDG